MTLTHDMIMAMDAGPELDALVAELMGWTKIQIRPQGINALLAAVPGPDGRTLVKTPAFSADILAAWQAWEEHGGGIVVGNAQEGYQIGQYLSAQHDVSLCAGHYTTQEPPPWDDSACPEAPTLPLAICRALLLKRLNTAKTNSPENGS